MGAIQKTITPIDDSLYVERPYAYAAEIEKTLKAAENAQYEWKFVSVADRQKLLTKAVNAFVPLPT